MIEYDTHKKIKSDLYGKILQIKLAFKRLSVI